MRVLYKILALLTAVCMALALTACTRGVSPVLETAGDDFDVIDVVEEAVSAQPPAQDAAGTPVSVTGEPSAEAGDASESETALTAAAVSGAAADAAAVSDTADVSDTAAVDAAASIPSGAEPETEPEPEPGTRPLTIAVGAMTGAFSPFYPGTDGDAAVLALTQLPLLPADRSGAVVLGSGSGETIPFHGADYRYDGAADVTVTANDDGTVSFDFTLRDGLYFADGEPVTADDVIFTMYVLCDPLYDGPSAFAQLPIVGLDDYRANFASLFDLLLAAGPDNDDFSAWPRMTQVVFWNELERAGEAFAQEIIDFCLSRGYAATAPEAAAVWGYDIGEDGGAAELFAALGAAYNRDFAAMSAAESAGSSFFELMEDYDAYTVGARSGESAATVAGIAKTGDLSVRVTLTGADAAVLDAFTLPIAPLHWYGDTALFDAEDDAFGFAKGDLRSVLAKTAEPLGAGPYRLVAWEDGAATLAANEYDFTDDTPEAVIRLTSVADDEAADALTTGAADVAVMAADDVPAGGTFAALAVEDLGYGYIGMNANALRIGGVSGSTESRALRRAFGTVLAAYRQAAVEAYYGGLASVIEYPMNTASWAVPVPGDEDYRIAFSVDRDGEPIYADGMTDEARYAAAAEAARGFLSQAGYSFDENGELSYAPWGAPETVTAVYVGGGTGDHPARAIFEAAADVFASLGVEMTVRELATEDELWEALASGEASVWAAAWKPAADPDAYMYELYYSGDWANDAGSYSALYGVDSYDLNELILSARNTVDRTERTALYHRCFALIDEWAVVVPLYERVGDDVAAFRTDRVDMSGVDTLTSFHGWQDEIRSITLK